MEQRGRIIVRIEFTAPDPEALKRIHGYVTRNVSRAIQRIAGDLSVGFYDWTGRRTSAFVIGDETTQPPETIPVESDLPNKEK